MAKTKNSRSEAKTAGAEAYRHREAESLLRPEVGVQPQFRKKKAPVSYRYDSSLAPELNWDGQNPARERGEAGEHGQIAVKVIDDRGNELMVVKHLKEAH